MKIAFLGLGKMGLPMARRLLEAGHELTIWNRSPERAASLVAAGAVLAATPAQAARDTDAVLTMLFDDSAHEAVLFGSESGETPGVLNALRPGALHIAFSTISVALSARLTAEHARRGNSLSPRLSLAGPTWPKRDAYGLWLPGPRMHCGCAAAAGAAGSRALRPGSEPSQAHALKLGGNFLISAMIHSLERVLCLRSLPGHRSGNLCRDDQQRALPVAVLRCLRQRDAEPAGAAGRYHGTGRQGSAVSCARPRPPAASR